MKVEEVRHVGGTSSYYGDAIDAGDGFGAGTRVRVIVETATPAPDTVFLNLDTATDEDNVIVERDFDEKGWSDHQPEDGIGWFPVALTAEQSEAAGRALIEAAEAVRAARG